MKGTTTLPVWLQVLVGIFSVLEPQFAWIQYVVEAAYELWQILPWFHKAGALIDLRKAVKTARDNSEGKPAGDTSQVESWIAKWKPIAAPLRVL